MIVVHDCCKETCIIHYIFVMNIIFVHIAVKL